MSLHKNLITLAIFAAVAPHTFADTAATTLDTIQLTAHPLVQTAADFAVADHVVDQKQLSLRAATIGDALADELGVYSNQYGSGSSRPVIRGQDGPRVKVLQHASETADVATLSPDHTITVDPLLAKQVEVIRGPSTLLYAAGTVGGLVNVTDQKIPTQMPQKAIEGSAALRYNSGSDEKLASAGVTAAIGEQFALRVEGLKRKANDYIAPDYVVAEPHGDHFHNEQKRRVDNTFAEGQTINVGGSWIHERGFVGLSYSNRQDQYGLPGHSHEYHGCELHADHFHCPKSDDNHDHDHEHPAGPWVDLKSERYDLRTELAQPFQGFEKLRAHASFTDYEHDELEDQAVISNFKSRGYDARLELVHVPVAGWEGVIGTQFSQQTIDLAAGQGHAHEEHDHEGHDHDHDEHEGHNHDVLMADTKTKKYSLFALEHKQIGDVHVELGARLDHQTIDVQSEQKNYSGTAYSASAAANWEFAPNYKLSVVGSHQQRLPLAQELYADGLHFATNTYELGNPNIDKETSNNLELGLHYEGDQFDYHAHVYHNWFDDYIYAATIAQTGNLRGVEYSQDKARFYGVEAQAGYNVNDTYRLSVFGDYVRGKIEGENAPRVPAGRLGTKVNANFDDQWSGSAEYYHVFKQDQFADFEEQTQGYNMVNVGLNYNGRYGNDQDYRVFLNANNLLDDQVYSHASFLSNIPQVGRNFTVGLEFNF
ncbi:zinc piracy TonB-dependent receptor ZnuD [uncultured Acinetobacter sp.]|uniref:zinc piracy TonB-dependent receptor ZnuD n=1 Tax=uncultured Acinetobacter sp. TaxID=165433 RepID=UPI00260C3803|nr:zinc piracy TonB-dependent receptor ZnuD [uncultured Acinetobacter sp.]